MITKKYKIEGMHCSSCAMDIDGELEDSGVEESRTSYAKATTEIKFDPEKIEEKKILTLIKKIGYKATPTPH